MKNSIHQVLIATLLLLFCSLAVGDGQPKAQEEYSEELTNGICGNSMYRECVKLSEEQCSNAFKKAISSCPFKYMESLDVKVIDSPCVTDKFLTIAKVPDKRAISCDKIFEEEVNSAIEQRKKNMLNKSFQPTKKNHATEFQRYA